jgi:hypothetical protein
MYSLITNPLTNRNVSINSKLGKEIIRNYVNILNGGGREDGLVKTLPSECKKSEDELRMIATQMVNELIIVTDTPEEKIARRSSPWNIRLTREADPDDVEKLIKELLPYLRDFCDINGDRIDIIINEHSEIRHLQTQFPHKEEYKINFKGDEDGDDANTFYELLLEDTQLNWEEQPYWGNIQSFLNLKNKIRELDGTVIKAFYSNKKR